MGIKFSFKKKYDYSKDLKKYKDIEFKLQQKIKNKNEKINVAFAVFSSSMFPVAPLAEFLIQHKSNRYNTKILLLPDLRFGENKVKQIMEKSYQDLSKIYAPDFLIKVPLNEYSDKTDLRKIADIIFFPFPYDISHPKYNLFSIVKKGILPAVVNYGFYRSQYDRKLISETEYSMFWKVFVETRFNLEEYKNFQQLKGANCELVGYCKMDGYAKYENIEKSRKKTVMISPHHSVDGGYNDILALSNFFKYADFFLKLPKLYPEIDFIFRPHPALFNVLSKPEFWGQQKVDKYIAEMKNHPNVIYSNGGSYFEEFAKSDGIINDCGSYLVEYFYTGKPQCYMLKSPSDIADKFTPLGQKCLENCSIAYNEQQITDFIENVIISGKDSKKECRERFAADEIMLNYPSVSAKIADLLDSIFFEHEKEN